jgi:hypothetical protein
VGGRCLSGGGSFHRFPMHLGLHVLSLIPFMPMILLELSMFLLKLLMLMLKPLMSLLELMLILELLSLVLLLL